MVRDAGRPSEENLLHERDQETRGHQVQCFECQEPHLRAKHVTFCLTFILQAIYELFRGEQDLIEDLQLARKVGHLFTHEFKKRKKTFL